MAEHIETDETAQLIASNKVEGTAVFDRAGERLGTIYNFMVDKVSGQVEYATLSMGGVLGIGSTYHPLPWDVLSYDLDRHGYVVDIDKATLEGGPRFAENEEPVYDRAYGQGVHQHYGVPYP